MTPSGRHRYHQQSIKLSRKTLLLCSLFLTTIFIMIRFSMSIILVSFFSEHILVRTSLPRCLCSKLLHVLRRVPNVTVMSFSHLCLDFPLLLFPATIPCIIVFSKPLWRETWQKYLTTSVRQDAVAAQRTMTFQYGRPLQRHS